jgi:hypothetical protein
MSTLPETGVDANDCNCNQDQQLHVPSESNPSIFLGLFLFIIQLYLQGFSYQSFNNLLNDIIYMLYINNGGLFKP